MNNCLFCKILNNEIPSEKVFENNYVLGFKDISPMAKEHYLFVHKKHTEDINQISRDEPDQFEKIFSAINEFSSLGCLAEDGFRVVSNVGGNGGQTVFHTHFHVLGGEPLKGFGA